MEEKESLSKKAYNVGVKAKKAGAVVGKVAGFIVANAGWIVPALLIFLIVVVAVALVETVVEGMTNIFDGGENAYISSVSGISDDYFYGARVIYKDETQANTEIEISFSNYICNVLINISKLPGTSIKFAIPEVVDENFDNQYVKGGVITMINAITGEDYTIDDYTEGLSKIDHFGLTLAEKTNVNSKLSIYIKDNISNIFNFSVETTLREKIDAELVVTNKTNLDFVSNRLFVRDMLLDGDNLKLPKLNYVAFIYMPKQDVTVTYLNYLFYIESETEVADYSVINSVANEANVIKTGTADYTWANSKEGFLKEEIIEQEINVKAFEGYNLDYSKILSDKNISFCDIAQYDYKNNKDIMSTYFSQNAENIVEYLPKDGLYLTFDCNIAFAFGENDINVK